MQHLRRAQIRGAILSGVAAFAGTSAFGQPTQTPTFEAASVRPSAPVPPTGGVYFGPARGGPGTPDPGQITWSYASMKAMLLTAFDAKNYQISGPAWLDTERYDVIAKVPAGATKEQVNAMWQNLLTERFGLTVRHQPKEFQVQELVIAKGGSKLKDTAEDPASPLPPGPPKIKNGELLSPGQVLTIFPGSSPHVHTVGRAQPISKLTELLSSSLGHPVLDKTGLTGKYDYALDYTIDLSGFQLPPPPPGAPAAASSVEAADPLPDLAGAMQQQLGLTLVAGKATLDVVVIDHLEKIPTEN
jgi:uncharacterized protein (TIGR03435 family)